MESWADAVAEGGRLRGAPMLVRVPEEYVARLEWLADKVAALLDANGTAVFELHEAEPLADAYAKLDSYTATTRGFGRDRIL